MTIVQHDLQAGVNKGVNGGVNEGGGEPLRHFVTQSITLFPTFNKKQVVFHAVREIQADKTAPIPHGY